MGNDEFQKLILEQLGELKQGQTELRQNQAKMEFELLDKISAITDGQKVTDDKLDKFITSTNANLNFLANSMDTLINKIEHTNADTALLVKRITRLEKLSK